MNIEGERMTSGAKVETMNEDMTTPSSEFSSPQEPREPGLTKGTWIGVVIIAVIVALVVLFGIAARHQSESTLEKDTKAEAIPSVNVIYPASSVLSSGLALPGNTQAYVDTPIYARTSGYLKNWYFDIGAHVRKGQLMAVIETPELDEQLQVAQADLKSSQANLNLANTTSARYQNLLTTNSVSKQETDVAVSDAAAKKAAVDASMASVRRLQQLQSFEKIYAPFDGIVTARNIDIGGLIQAGENTTPKELFHLAAIQKIRVFVSVPEAYSTSIKEGGKASLTLDEYPDRSFEGTIVRNSNAIDSATRTLNVEVDVDNPKGELLPGAYVFVHFKVPEHSSNLMIPSNTLLFRAQGLQVGVVRDGKVQLVPVTISKDLGANVEIASGLTTKDAVLLDPSDSLANGQEVQVKSRVTEDATQMQKKDGSQ
ncbi:efflux RND transporter periplasmic adaptor subunit [Granulicella sp. S190]|uniref:efflux RND transporter periplasmic adaptor subunit n=1 Tax=Granulicella sp. S190 TaxID=1747226 RepID=UPI0020B14474|nr:efflux RND transporter periplasmic adaptor subunit [Granulicella sp. S190]